MRRPYISKTVFTTLFAILGFWIAGTQPVAAHSGRVFSAFVPRCPTNPADYFVIGARAPLVLPDRTGAVIVMNDPVNLCILLAVPEMAVDPREGRVLFDDNHNGIVELMEDRLRVKLSSGFLGFEDSHRSDRLFFTVPNESLDTTDGGTNDGIGFTIPPAGDPRGTAYFVFIHPLASSDVDHDIQVWCASQMSVIGANFGADDFAGHGGFVHDTEGASKWDDIQIACPGVPRLDPLQNGILQMGQRIGQLPDSAFKNGLIELRATLVSKVDEVARMADAGNLRPAANKLANDILPKLNPAGKNCWVCGGSPEPSIVYQSALELLAEIEAVQGVSPEPSMPTP